MEHRFQNVDLLPGHAIDDVWLSCRRPQLLRKAPRHPAMSPVTVFVHVYYPEIWQEMSAHLAHRLNVPFDLVLTTTDEDVPLALPETPFRVSHRILKVDNRGRDILPFLTALAGTSSFEIGLKLHTKKSPQRADGALWLARMLDSLLPPAPEMERVLARMRADPRIGLVAPTAFCLPVEPWVLTNRSAMQTVMSSIGHNLSQQDLQDTYFAAGSMFWFREPAVRMLADERVQTLFEPEEGQLDGTVAHAMERLFPVEARRSGYFSVCVETLMAGSPEMRTAELLALVRENVSKPNPLFPAPYESPPSAEIASPETQQPKAPEHWMRRVVAPVYRKLPTRVRSNLNAIVRR